MNYKNFCLAAVGAILLMACSHDSDSPINQCSQSMQHR